MVIETSIIGPDRVKSYDPKTRVLVFEEEGPVILGPTIRDTPTVGFSCAVKLAPGPGRTAAMLLSLTADCIIHTKGEVLMIQRKRHPCMGAWAMPGGFIDPGETPEKAAIRELKEETGVAVTGMKFAGLYNKVGRDERQDHVWTYVHAVLLSKKPLATAGDDASLAQWVPIHKLRSMDLAFDHKEILTNYFRSKMSAAPKVSWKKSPFQDERAEFERVVKTHVTSGGTIPLDKKRYDQALVEIKGAYNKARLVSVDKTQWKKIHNTSSFDMTDLDQVRKSVAAKSQSVDDVVEDLLSETALAPVCLAIRPGKGPAWKAGFRWVLVSGDIQMMVARALGVQLQVVLIDALWEL